MEKIDKETKIVDLSHRIESGMITYKGLPGPVICDFLSREASKQHYGEGETFQIGKIEMVANTGTYIDVPFHRYKNGKDLSEVQLKKMVDLEGIVIRAEGVQAIDEKFFQNKKIRNRAVLVQTNWSKYWRTEAYFNNPPFLTKSAAEYLMRNGAGLVGIDAPNIDNISTNTRPAHSILLYNNILIVEHLCHLDQLPDENFLFSAVPPKFVGVGSFPVRAYAKWK